MSYNLGRSICTITAYNLKATAQLLSFCLEVGICACRPVGSFLTVIFRMKGTMLIVVVLPDSAPGRPHRRGRCESAAGRAARSAESGGHGGRRRPLGDVSAAGGLGQGRQQETLGLGAARPVPPSSSPVLSSACCS